MMQIDGTTLVPCNPFHTRIFVCHNGCSENSSFDRKKTNPVEDILKEGDDVIVEDRPSGRRKPTPLEIENDTADLSPFLIPTLPQDNSEKTSFLSRSFEWMSPRKRNRKKHEDTDSLVVHACSPKPIRSSTVDFLRLLSSSRISLPNKGHFNGS